MPINPEIALQGRPVQFDSPGLVNLMQQGQHLRMQQDQLRMQQESHAQQMQTGALALQEHQRQVTEGQQLRDVFKASPDLRTALPEVFKINPTVGIAMQKSLHEQEKAALDLRKTDIEVKAKIADRLGSIAGTMHDEPTFHQGIVTGLNEGLIKAEDAQKLLEQGWTPESQAYVQQIVKAALTTKEQHDIGLADIKAKQDALASQHEAELHPYRLEKSQTEASAA
jgi:hypothetical protein